eukprot:CAMPEP_0118645898 /NCGR_PEP_ID=MMETSP0785-20121206/7755_1 /TAXON_ID=91992 /ORGANISM="Bolidomonas pacifica, Strain CCMP 1866" /LENGTH=159 /DNA_ID=CAMNT_0006537829 /DNA_START=309 /DNA_END=785 /DNA_ORIENTATION=+
MDNFQFGNKHRSLPSRIAEGTFRGAIWGGLWSILFGKVEMMDFYTSRSALPNEFTCARTYVKQLPARLLHFPTGALNGAAAFSIWYSLSHVTRMVTGVENQYTQTIGFIATAGGLYRFHHENPYVKQPPTVKKSTNKKPLLVPRVSNSEGHRRMSTMAA